MKAMIFAAGRGSRLRPLTDKIPKALVRLKDQTLLENIIRRLIKSGVGEILINVHHLADQIISFTRDQNNFGIKITFSEEKELLDTGGGLKKGAWFFSDEKPFLVHNVDILSDIDLNKLYQYHLNHQALATLVVKQRHTSRYLLFDSEELLVGRQVNKNLIMADPDRDTSNFTRLSFLGIHVVSPELFQYFPREESIFSILDIYLKAAADGARIQSYQPDHTYWFDLGRPETLASAQQFMNM